MSPKWFIPLRGLWVELITAYIEIKSKNNNYFLEVLMSFHNSHNLDHVWGKLRWTGLRKNSHAGAGLQPVPLGMLYLADPLAFGGRVWSPPSYVTVSLVFFNSPENLLKSFWLIRVCPLHGYWMVWWLQLASDVSGFTIVYTYCCANSERAYKTGRVQWVEWQRPLCYTPSPYKPCVCFLKRFYLSRCWKEKLVLYKVISDTCMFSSTS